MKIHQIYSTGYAKGKVQEHLESEFLISLYEKYKQKPFNYAVINYHKDGTARMEVHQRKSIVESVKNGFKKLLKLFK